MFVQCALTEGETHLILVEVVLQGKTTTTDSGGYVVGLHISASTRVGASLGSGYEESEPPASQKPSGVYPSQTPCEAPASHKASESPASQLTKGITCKK